MTPERAREIAHGLAQGCLGGEQSALRPGGIRIHTSLCHRIAEELLTAARGAREAFASPDWLNAVCDERDAALSRAEAAERELARLGNVLDSCERQRRADREYFERKHALDTAVLRAQNEHLAAAVARGLALAAQPAIVVLRPAPETPEKPTKERP